MNATTMMLYTGSSFSPNSALKFDWPKKYQPMIVENAKKNMHTAMKIGPKPPNAWLKAAWVSDVPVMPCGIRPDVISTRPVSVSTTNVSTNTPRIATAPWSCGHSTLASAWAWGVEPRPASLENRPRATPKRMDCCTVTPAMPPAMACGSNASTNTCASAPGSALALMTKMTMQPRM